MAEPKTYDVYLEEPCVAPGGLASTTRAKITSSISFEAALKHFQSKPDDYELYALVDADNNAIIIENNEVMPYPGKWKAR